jgi:hypothetical protein
MKTSHRLAFVAALSCGILFLPACSSVTGEQTTSASAEYGVPGGAVRQTTQIRATVTAVNSATRQLSLVTPAGEKRTITAAPEVANFGQIRVGDQLIVTYTEEILLRMARQGEVIEEGSSLAGMRNELGAKPGAALGQASQMKATVTAIDAKKRRVQLRFSDGSSKSFPVRDDIDLSRHRVGEVVVIRHTEGLAVKVEKP